MSTTTEHRGVVIVPARLNVKEAAHLLGQHPESVKRNVRLGRLRGGKIGQKVIIDGNHVAEILRGAGVNARVEDVVLP